MGNQREVRQLSLPQLRGSPALCVIDALTLRAACVHRVAEAAQPVHVRESERPCQL
jgi:hypothetical protein